ncbi:MAG: hypothetical protein IJ284_00200 [Clostridia bacterium]|nr:hypothetical protein [Clostridia bacterium]
METLKKLRILNSNALKLLAAIFMFVDHFGLIFFPKVMWLRMIGRLSMPLFAFAIAEGCRYTKNKWKHFALLFGLGAACQLVYFIFDPDSLYLGILITFSLSTLIIYAMQYAKKCTFDKEAKWWLKIASWLLFLGLILGVYVFCRYFTVDYGFYGCMLPVFASIFDLHRIPAPDRLKKLDVLPLRILCMAIPMIPLLFAGALGVGVTWCSFLSIPLLLLYNGEKGKRNMKYFFYIFYPLHLGLLEGIQILTYILQ